MTTYPKRTNSSNVTFVIKQHSMDLNALLLIKTFANHLVSKEKDATLALECIVPTVSTIAQTMGNAVMKGALSSSTLTKK